MDKVTKGSISSTSVQQTTFPSKKVSYDKIKISELCYRKNAHVQNQNQSKPYIAQVQENIILCQKTKVDERRSTQTESELSADIIQRQNNESSYKNLQITDYLNNGINLKVLKVNNTPKNSCQKNLQIAKNIKIPNKANVNQQQQQSSLSQIQSKKTHLKHQTLLHDRARSNGTEEDDSKQILAACSNSPQSRNTITGTTSEFFKQQIQVYSQRDARYQLNKKGDKKKQSVGSNEQTGLKIEENSNSKKQRNRSEQMGGKQLFTLNSQSQFATLPRQSPKQENFANSLKRNNEISHEKQKIIYHETKESSKTTSIDTKKNNFNQKQQNSYQMSYKEQQLQASQQNDKQNINKLITQESTQTKNDNKSQEKKIISDKSQEKKVDATQINSQINKYKLKETDIQKFSLLFLQQQKKQSQDMTKKQSISHINKKDQNTLSLLNQDGSATQIILQKQQQELTPSRQLAQASKQKSPDHIFVQENSKPVQKQISQKQIKSERPLNNQNDSNSHSQQQYGRINKEAMNQMNFQPFGGPNQNHNNTQQILFATQQDNQQKQRMVSLNSRQSIVHSSNLQQEDEDLIALQQFSSPFLRSSSSSKEPNRRYEKQPLEKKNEIDKKIKDYLESKQQNTSSQDLSSRKQIIATPSIVTNSTSNNTNSNQNSKCGHSNTILLNSNLISSNVQQISKENSRQPTQNSNQQFQINLEESQLHFLAEDTSASHYSQGSSIKKNHLQSQKEGNHQNSNNTPHRQQKVQLKSSVNCQMITPSTCDGKQQVTLVSPMISNFVISPSSKVITLSPKPYLTTDNEEQDDQDMIITFSENVNTEGSEDIPASKQQSVEERDENQHKRTKTYQPYNTKQEAINTKLESRLGALELEMSSIIQRCVNLEVTNKSLNTNIDKITVEKEIIKKENEIYKLKIEELQLINKQQEDTIGKLLYRITNQKASEVNNISTSQLKTNRNKTDCSNFMMNTENSTAELSSYPNAENMSSFSQSKGFYKSDAFSSARGAPVTAQNNSKSKKEINQYFSNMINNSQSKQLLPQTFQGYLNQKNLQNLMANSQMQNSNSLTQNDSILQNKHVFSQSAKNQQQQQQQLQQQQVNSAYHFQNGNFEDEQTQASSYRNDYYLSSRHGIQNLYKQ